jgi:hypothetical protein
MKMQLGYGQSLCLPHPREDRIRKRGKWGGGGGANSDYSKTSVVVCTILVPLYRGDFALVKAQKADKVMYY